MKKFLGMLALISIVLMTVGCPQPTDSEVPENPPGNITDPEPQPGKVSPPVITPASGVYDAGSLSISISVPEGAVVYYTIDNTPPTVNSTKYEAPFSIIVGVSEVVVKAIAVKDEMTDSEVVSATYTMQGITVSPIFTPDSSIVEDGTAFSLSSITDGALIFYTSGDTAQATSNPLSDGWIWYEEGNAAIQFDGKTSIVYSAIAVKDGLVNSAVSSVTYNLRPTVQNPTFDMQGSDVGEGTALELSSTTDGAEIYYTSGDAEKTTSDPVADGWTLYEYGSAKILFGEKTRITYSAIAVKDEMTNSEVVSATYNRRVATPEILYLDNPLVDDTAIQFSNGLTFTCDTLDVEYSIKYSGENTFTKLPGNGTNSIKEGSTSITVKASKAGYADSIEKTVNYYKLYVVGEEGPAGGTIFYADNKGGYREISDVLNTSGVTWADAKTMADGYTGGNYTDWYLPTRGVLNEYGKSRIDLDYDNSLVYWSADEEGYWTGWTEATPPENPTKAWSVTIRGASASYYSQDKANTQWDGQYGDINVRAVRAYNPKAYELGDTGPGGGTIYWVGEGNSYKEVSENLTALNYSSALNESQWPGHYSYVTNPPSHFDWHIPNATELNEVFLNAKLTGLITETDTLWSCSEAEPPEWGGSRRWVQDFDSDSSVQDYSYNSEYSLRIIREFNTTPR